MARTQIPTSQIKDGGITRADVNTTTVGSALITKVVQGSGVTIASTGADSGTGDVTISVSGTGHSHAFSELTSKPTTLAGYGINDAASRTYVQSRGVNLITNGTGLIGNNYNFSLFTASSTDVYSGQVAFGSSTGGFHATNDEAIPVDPNKYYRFTFAAKSTVFSAANSYAYAFSASLDIDGNAIMPPHYTWHADTMTTLAAPLKPGDTVITVDSVANWGTRAGINTYVKIHKYKTGTGMTFGTQTYSRNITSSNPYTSINVNTTNKTVTLSAPWPASAANPDDLLTGAWPVGTPISTAFAGGTYQYFTNLTNVSVPNTWTQYSGVIGGIQSDGSLAVTKFPPGTAYIKVGFLLNRTSPGAAGTGNTTFVSGLNLSDLSIQTLTGGLTPSATNSVNINGAAFTFNNGILTGYTGSFGSIADSQITGVGWSKISSKPTTLAGYGITDAYTTTQINNALSGKADKATTLSGYGITDAATATHNHDTVYLKKTGDTLNNTTLAGILTSTGNAPMHIKLAGQKSWIMHRSGSNLFFAPSATNDGTDWDWAKQTYFDSTTGALYVEGTKRVSTVGHDHSAADITSGTLSNNRLIGGTYNVKIGTYPQDERSTATTPNDYNANFALKFKTLGTAGITDGGSYVTTIGARAWTDPSGGNAFEIASTDSSNLWYRTGSTTTWNAWNKLWHSGNFTNLNQLTTRNFSDLQNKPTSLSGYGITDMTTTSQVILNGGNDIILRGDDSGDIIFQNSDQSEKARIWSGSGTLNFSTAAIPTNHFQVTSSNAYVSGNAVWHAGNLTPSQYLMKANSTPNSDYSYRDLASFNYTNGNLTGTMKITLPKSWSDTMLRYVITGFDYRGNSNWEVVVSGYNYSGGFWVNTGVEIRGYPPFDNVRLAHDGTKCVILLGTMSTVWSYPKILVSHLYASHATTWGWDAGTTIGVLGSETGITAITEPVSIVRMRNDGVYSISTNTQVTGSVSATGGFYQSSTRDVKENIKPVEFSALDLISQTEVVNFNYITDFSKEKRIGFIAEETPVELSGSRHKEFRVSDTVGVLIKAVQELQSEVEELRERLDNARE